MQLKNKKILVCGGTKQQGLSIVNSLIDEGADITIANRGKENITDFKSCKSLILDRIDRTSCENALRGLRFDAIIDTCAYSDVFVKNLLDFVKTEKYVQISSNAVYRKLCENQAETDFDPTDFDPTDAHLTTGDFNYQLGKRAAEHEALKYFFDSTIIRCPYIYGTHDFSGRLKWFVQRAVNNEIFVARADWFFNKFSVSHETEAGKLILFLLKNDKTGIYNAATECGDGGITAARIIHYLQQKLNKDIMVQFSSVNHLHYNGVPSSYLNTDKAKQLGYEFINETKFFETIDYYVDELKK